MNTNDINELVTQLYTDDVTAKEAARDLRELASLDEATRDAVYRAGTIFALVARMRPRGAAGVLQEAAGALAILVRSEKAARQAMVLNAPRALVQLLQHDSEAVRFEAAMALREMAGGSSSSFTTSIKNGICKEGALVHLVELLGSDSSPCRVEAALALWWGRGTGIPGLGLALQQCCEGACSLAGFAFTCRRNASLLEHRASIPPALLTHCRRPPPHTHHPARPTLPTPSNKHHTHTHLHASRVLARDHSDSQAGIVAAGGVAALIRLLSDGSRDAQDNAAGALTCLAGGDAHVRVALTEAGAAEALEQVVHDTEWPLVRGRALTALHWLAAAYAPAAVQVADAGMADAGALAAAQVAGAGMADAGAQAAAQVADPGMAELLRQLAEADDAEARNLVLAVLAGFCSTDPAAVVAAGGLQLLKQLAKQKDATTCQLVARCLRRIVADQAQNTAAVEAKAIPTLVSLLEYDESAEEAAWALW